MEENKDNRLVIIVKIEKWNEGKSHMGLNPLVVFKLIRHSRVYCIK